MDQREKFKVELEVGDRGTVRADDRQGGWWQIGYG